MTDYTDEFIKFCNDEFKLLPNLAQLRFANDWLNYDSTVVVKPRQAGWNTFTKALNAFKKELNKHK